MNWIKGLIVRLIGKHLKDNVDGGLTKVGISREKLVAVLAVLMPIIEPLSAAIGHPVKIPVEVYGVLGGLGLWSNRDRANTEKASQGPTPIN